MLQSSLFWNLVFALVYAIVVKSVDASPLNQTHRALHMVQASQIGQAVNIELECIVFPKGGSMSLRSIMKATPHNKNIHYMHSTNDFDLHPPEWMISHDSSDEPLPKVFVMMRHPVLRLVSEYNYCGIKKRYGGTWEQYLEVARNGRVDLICMSIVLSYFEDITEVPSLDTWAEKRGNFMLAFLYAHTQKEVLNDDKTVFRSSKEHDAVRRVNAGIYGESEANTMIDILAEQPTAIGITEEFCTSMFMLAHAADIAIPTSLMRQHVNGNKKIGVNELNEEQESIARYMPLDLKVYAALEEDFQRRKAKLFMDTEIAARHAAVCG